MPIVAITLAAVALTWLASRIVTVGAAVYPEPGVTTSTEVTTPPAFMVAVPVAGVPPGRSGTENWTIGWIAYPDPPSVMVRLSTPPLATAVPSEPAVGWPPARLTVGQVSYTHLRAHETDSYL